MTPEQRAKLMQLAVMAREHAYAPYSQYAVGAAVLTESGEFFSGCNIENASYGLTVCAERTAVAGAVAAGQRRFVALAVATINRATPCGACRQVLGEFADELPVLLVDAADPRQVTELTLSALLPLRFVSEKS